MGVLLEVDRIDVFYGRIQALRGVSLHVDEGEIVTLIGANGAGKTTTLRAISGLTPASSGNIRIRGQDITRMQAEDIVTLPGHQYLTNSEVDYMIDRVRRFYGR